MSAPTLEQTNESALPAGWEQRSLGEIAQVRMGNSPPGDSYNDDGRGIPKGSTFPCISQQQLLDLQVPLPFPNDRDRSIAEQKRIADILDKADAIRRRECDVPTQSPGQANQQARRLRRLHNPPRRPHEQNLQVCRRKCLVADAEAEREDKMSQTLPQ